MRAVFSSRQRDIDGRAAVRHLFEHSIKLLEEVARLTCAGAAGRGPVFRPYRLHARFGETVARLIAAPQLGALAGSRTSYRQFSPYADCAVGAPGLMTAMERGHRALRFVMRGA